MIQGERKIYRGGRERERKKLGKEIQFINLEGKGGACVYDIFMGL